MNTWAESFPLQLPGVVLELIDDVVVPPAAKPGEHWRTVRLIRFDLDGSITDIMEQPIRIARASAMLEDAERVRHCVDAHRQVLAELFERHRERTLGLVPAELLFFDQLLALARASTVDDFARALLAKARLGAYLA